MDIRRNIDSKSYMDLRGYFLLFPLTSYFPIFPYASNGYKKEYRQYVLYGSQEIPSCKFKGRSLQDFLPHVPWSSSSVNLKGRSLHDFPPMGPWNSSPVNLRIVSPPCSMKLFFCKFKGRSLQDFLFYGPWNSSPVNLRVGHYRKFSPMSHEALLL